MGGTLLPFTAGQAFREGDVPAGVSVTSNIAELQVIGKNRWPDGSMKFALVSGRVNVGAGASVVVPLLRSNVSASTGSVVSTADLRTTGAVALVDCGANGNASWSAADWDAPFLTWVSGSEMSSWIYRKPIGSDAHLVAWLEVRCYRGGAVEILPWIENGYLLVAAPGARSGMVTFTLGGSQRFSQSLTLLNHQRAVLASGTVLSHWLGTDPQLTPTHDTAYMQATRLTPAYRGHTSQSSALWTRQAASYTPLAQAGFPNNMGSAGYDTSIGPLPEWDVAYLTSSGDPRALRACMINGYAAGRYGIHFRDEATNRVPRFSTHTGLVLADSSNIKSIGSGDTTTPTASGSPPPQYYTSHAPALGYFAYLLTGRFYFMEETQFQAIAAHFKTGAASRQGAKGTFEPSAGAHQTRSAAWSWRTLAYCASATPDDDTALRNEFVASLGENASYLLERYGRGNPFGVVKNYSSYADGVPAGDLQSTHYGVAPWQEDFLTYAICQARELKILAGAAASVLDQLVVWKCQSVVGRLGSTRADEYSFKRAAQYEMIVARTPTPDWAAPGGGWLSDWGEVFRVTHGYANDASTTPPNLVGGYFPDPTSYWGNMVPAISFAVDAGVTGARAAYDRVVGAANFAEFEAGFDDNPVWGVRPRSV